MGEADEIVIQIRPDGSVAFSALPAELLELAAQVNPTDANIARRVAILRQARGAAEAQVEVKESIDVADESD